MKPLDSLTILKHQSLPDLVQERLETMILEGALLPGAQLREVNLAVLLGISRGPIREAFRGLEEKGLVQVVKNCGVFVRTLALEEADQIYEVRIVLEAMVGQKVAAIINAEGLAELETILEHMSGAAGAGDITRYTALNLKFHDTLARLSGNPKLHETYRRLVSELSLFRRQTYVHDESSMPRSLEEHRNIHAALAARKPALAAELLQQHAADSRARLHLAMEPGANASLHTSHSIEPSP